MPLTVPGAYESIIGGVDYALLSMNFDPSVASGTSTALAPSGTVFVMRIPVPRPMLVTNLHIYVMTQGTTLTSGQCLAALYQNNSLLSATATQHTAWQSTGFKTMALTTPSTVTPGNCDVCFYANGTTGPSPMKATSTVHNMGLATPNMRAATADTGRTTTFPSTLGTETSNANLYWVGVS